MHGRFCPAVPVLLQTQSVTPFGDHSFFIVSVSTPVPKEHPAESQLSNPSLVTHVWATNVIARLLRACEHFLHSGAGPRASADRSVSVLFGGIICHGLRRLGRSTGVSQLSGSLLRLDSFVDPCFANHATLLWRHWQEGLSCERCHGLRLVEISSVSLCAAKTNARHKTPQASEAIGQRVVAKDVPRMRHAEKLYQHVYVQSLSHLGLHYAKIPRDVSEDA